MIDQYYEIQLAINKIIEDLKKIPHHNTSVFFMGESGSGKGTLINYLIKNPYLYAQASPTGQIVIKSSKKNGDLEDQIEISENMTSQTSIPKEAQSKGEIFKDFPGFHDNRQQHSIFNQDIINQFYIRDVFTKTLKFKIVFLTSKSGISDRGTEFLHSIRTFSKQFKDIKPILNSICLVVSKAQRHILPYHIKASLQKIETELLEDLTENEKLLLRHFVEDSKIEVFHSPSQQGKLDFSSVTKIHRMIESLEYTQLKEQISISVESKSHMKIHQLLQKWNHQISLTIPQMFQALLGDFIQAEFLKFEQFQENKRLLFRFLSYLQELQSFSSYHHEQFYQSLKNTPRLRNCGDQKAKGSLIKIGELYRFIDFFKSFDVQPFDVIKWKQRIYRVKHFLYELLQDPRYDEQVRRSNSQKFIQIKGFSCDSDQIQKIAEENFQLNNPERIERRITVMCYILNLNSDIQIPGTDLVLFSEWIRVPNPISINLRGKDAVDLDEEQGPNTDGTPGLPGENGGSFIIKTRHYCRGLNSVTVDIRGGKGGLGKSGGIVKIPVKEKIIKLIENDVKKPTQHKQLMIERDTYKFSDKNFVGKIAHILRSLGTFNEQILQKYSTSNYSKQKFFQTVGGCNGLTGNMGRLQIGKIPYEIQLKKILNDRKSYGYKEIYEGVYLKQMVFASIRQEGRPPAKIQKSQAASEQSKIQFPSDKKIRQTQSKNQFPSDKKISQTQSFKQAQSRSQSRSRKSSVCVSEFSINNENLQLEVDSDLQDEQPKHEKTFAQSIQTIANAADLEQQILIALFKFNEQRSKKRKESELQKIEEEKQANQIKKKIDEPKQCGLIKRKPESIVHKDGSMQQIVTHDHFVRTVKNHKKLLNNHTQKSQNFETESSNEFQIMVESTNPLSRSTTLNFYSEKKIGEVQNPEFRLSRASTLPPVINERQLRKRYLQANIQNLTKTQLLELIKIRSEDKQKIIVTKEERDKFSLMISKELLNQFGKQIATDIGTQVIHNVGKDIVKNVSRQVAINTTSKQLGKEFIIKGTEGLGKGFIGHELGKQTLHSLSAQSMKEIGKKATEKSVNIELGTIADTIMGISKSFILQTIISALLASGITDRWLVKPHFQSKKMESGIFNEQGLMPPHLKQNLNQAQMSKYWDEFKQLINYYDTRTLNYLCQRQSPKDGFL